MEYYLIILRLLHICSGVFWAGTAIYLAVFILPAVNASGPEGGKFMQQLAQTNNFPVVLSIAGLVSVLSGLLLIWKLSDGLNPAWVTSRHGIILISGATTAIIAFSIGFFSNRPILMKIGKMSMEIAKTGAPPSESQITTMNNLRNKIVTNTNIIATLLSVTVITMSLIRYL